MAGSVVVPDLLTTLMQKFFPSSAASAYPLT
jgi:hypothetical protein